MNIINLHFAVRHHDLLRFPTIHARKSFVYSRVYLIFGAADLLPPRKIKRSQQMSITVDSRIKTLINIMKKSTTRFWKRQNCSVGVLGAVRYIKSGRGSGAKRVFAFAGGYKTSEVFFFVSIKFLNFTKSFAWK